MAEERKIEEFESLTDEDLLGLKTVRLVRGPWQSRSIDDFNLFMDVIDDEGTVYRVCIIGRETYECLKRNGFKRNGQIYFRIPARYLKPKGVGWINQPW